MHGTTPERLRRFQAVLNGFRELRKSASGSRLTRMAEVLRRFRELPRTPSFNMLDILRVGPDELTHSGVLAWLLDAAAGHGQGPVFLNMFADALELPVSVKQGRPYLVRREFSGRESIIDVVFGR